MTLALLLLLAAGPDAGLAAPPADAVLKPAIVLAETKAPVLTEWHLKKPAERAALKGQLGKVTVKQRVVAALFLDGWELPKSRRVDVTADVVLTDPTGRVVLEKASAAIATEFDPRIHTALALTPHLPIILGATDPDGEYVLKVTVWDQVRGISAKTELRFKVGP